MGSAIQQSFNATRGKYAADLSSFYVDSAFIAGKLAVQTGHTVSDFY
jgi:hypothetical protein